MHDNWKGSILRVVSAQDIGRATTSVDYNDKMLAQLIGSR